MAESLIDEILQRYAYRLEGDFRPCMTAETPLVGGEMAEFQSYLKAQSLGLVDRWGLSLRTVEHLIRSYGRSHMDILALGFGDRKLLEPLCPGCPVVKAEVIYAVEDEMAVTLEDFMSRRTDLMHFYGNGRLPVLVAKLMGRRLGWKRARRKAEIHRYRQAVEEMFQFRSPSQEDCTV
jgi:glycerol-3-phosphate dehydrogenase